MSRMCLENCVCVRDDAFSYIISPLESEKRLRASSKDFYFERDWSSVVNEEVMFTFNNTL